MKKWISILLLPCLLFSLAACSDQEAAKGTKGLDESLVENETDSLNTQAIDTGAEHTEEDQTTEAAAPTAAGEDALANVLAALGEQSVFYSFDDPAQYYSMEMVFSGAPGVYHYGKSVLYGATLLYEFLPSQQSEILARLQSIDTSTLEQTEKSVVQELAQTSPSSQFITYVENPNGSSCCVEIYLFYLNADGETPTEVVVRACDYAAGLDTYYLGQYDEKEGAVYLGLEDMYMECRASAEVLDDTALITLPGETAVKTLTRWMNARVVNIVDGTVQGGLALEDGAFDEEAYDAKLVIEGDEYLVDLDSGLIRYASNTYQLTESGSRNLEMYLSQAQ